MYTLCEYARYAKETKLCDCASYTGTSYWSEQFYKDLNDILSCLSLNDSFPNIRKAYPDMETKKPEHSMFIFFYDTSTNKQINITDALTIDTTNESELKRLDNLGILFKISKPNERVCTIIKVPFKNSLQKKVVIRYLQRNLILNTLALNAPSV